MTRRNKSPMAFAHNGNDSRHSRGSKALEGVHSQDALARDPSTQARSGHAEHSSVAVGAWSLRVACYLKEFLSRPCAHGAP